MSQYRIGTVQVTNGSPIVTAVDPDPGDVLITPQQQWLTEAQPGYLFVVEGDNTLYVIQSVDSDIQLTLTTNFTGASTVVSPTPQEGDSYALVRDFSDNFGFPLVSPGDISTASVMEKAITMIDDEFATFNNLVEGEEPIPPPPPPPPPEPPPEEDTDPPTVPQNVAVEVLSDTQLSVTWDASTDVGGGSVAGYKVYRWGIYQQDVLAGTFYLDSDLDPNTEYSYTISAFDDAEQPNTSAQSDPASGTTLLYTFTLTGVQVFAATPDEVVATFNDAAEADTALLNGFEVVTDTGVIPIISATAVGDTLVIEVNRPLVQSDNTRLRYTI